jgi:hypothetical protein
MACAAGTAWVSSTGHHCRSRGSSRPTPAALAS